MFKFNDKEFKPLDTFDFLFDFQLFLLILY